MGYLKDLVEFRFVLLQLVRQQLALRYRRTFFGYMWTLLNPLLMISVTAVVFSTIFKMDLKSYGVFLVGGMLPFTFFSAAVTQSGQALVGNEGLIKKIFVPKLLFPLAVSLTMLIDSALTTVAFIIIIFLVTERMTAALLFLPVAYAVLFLFAFGIALVMAICTVYVRDLQHIVGILMQALLFLTPVFYKPESLDGAVAKLVAHNPLTPFIELFRAPIYLGALPASHSILTAGALAGASALFGIWFFRRHEGVVAFRL